MTYFDFLIPQLELDRKKTVAVLERAAEADALGWRPGEGRAHVAWQVMHVAATEESFARERLVADELVNPDTVAAYRHGSTPSDDIPDLDAIRSYLTESRAILLKTIEGLSESDLDTTPPQLESRGWTIREALQLLVWHEGHHQGQSHITMNLFDLQNG